MAEPLVSRHEGGQLGDEADRGVVVRLVAAHVPARVEHAQHGHAGLQGVHGVAVLRHELEGVDDLVLDAPVMGDLVFP